MQRWIKSFRLPYPWTAIFESFRIEAEEARVRASNGDDCDMTLKNNIEGIIIKWAYQIDEVLRKNSAEELNETSNNPGPMTEIRFWEAKCTNLESLFEQMKADTTKKMASILDVTDSAYYPAFRAMFRNVVAALNEAQDITLFLKPLAVHFEVRSFMNFTLIKKSHFCPKKFNHYDFLLLVIFKYLASKKF